MGKLITWQEASAQRARWREQAKTVVFTNGHFDLLHIGHLDYLEKAKALGDILIVGINGDNASALLKGTGRPIIPAQERARLVAALTPVNATIIFDDETAIGLIGALMPDIYVKGGDYAHKPLPERAAVEQYGGIVQLIDYLPDHSTSRIIAKIQSLPDA